MMEFDGGGAAVPGAMVVIGRAGAEAKRSEEGLGGGKLWCGHQEIKVAAGAERGVAVQAFGEDRAFEGNGEEGGCVEGAEEAS